MTSTNETHVRAEMPANYDWFQHVRTYMLIFSSAIYREGLREGTHEFAWSADLQL